jgi:predicted AlkP superfamily phosphohydrolase/phosphomutase
VLGIDAANPSLLLEWAESGLLPNIAALIARGLVAPSRSLDGFFVGSTWPSLYTGTSPAKHGIHYLLQLKPGTYDLHRPSDGAFVLREPFWNALSRAGKRVAILDVPLSRLDPSLNGVQVVEWGGHDAIFGFQAHPPEFEADVRSRFGTHPAGTQCDAARRSPNEYEQFIDLLLRGARAKGRLTRDVMRREPWDLLMQVFTEAHCAGHQCWHLTDRTHPAHDPAVTAVTGNPLQRVYVAIDEAIGEIVADAGDMMIMLVIGHGMSYRYGASFLLEKILMKLGVSVAHPSAPAPFSVGDVIAPIWRMLPADVQRTLRPLRDRIRGDLDAPPPAMHVMVDTHASKCFLVNNGLATGGIRLNLKGREPHGIVEPGAEADAFCAALTDDLLAIVDERTTRRLVRRVIRTADMYRGEHLDALPDLLVDWSDEVPTGSSEVGRGTAAKVRAHSAKIGVVEGINDYGRTGEHRIEGLLVGAGAGIRHGRVDRAVSVMDVAPTIAAMFGVPLDDPDGQVIREFV